MTNAYIMLEKWRIERGFDTFKELAEFIGVAQNTLDVWKRRGDIPPKNIKKYADLVKNLDKNLDNNEDINSNSYQIQRLTCKASAGKGNNLDNIEVFSTGQTISIDKIFFKVPPSSSLRAIQVDGYSMVPMLLPDSWVIFEENREFKGDGLYIINYANELMVKLLQVTPSGVMKIISKNPDYESFEVRVNESSEFFRIVGKVVRSII